MALAPRILCPLLVAAMAFCFNSVSDAQVSFSAPSVLKQAMNESSRTTLLGNTRPEANLVNDRGPVADGYSMPHMLLQLRRPAEQQQALNRFTEELYDPTSANFHKWLTASQFGQRFGIAEQDLNTTTNWLRSHGFTVNGVSPNLVIDFSGSAAQVSETFHTQIHRLVVNGKVHQANMSDPQIPSALEPLVAGIASLHDFMPHASEHAVPAYAAASGSQLVVPPDLATIYNLQPAFGAGVAGRGQTIVVLEDSDLYSAGDWLVFRKLFGLARPYPQGNLLTVHPGGAAGNCFPPGVNADDVEAILDVEWASAAAPNATIELASCANTFTFGGFIALQNLLTAGGPVPSIVSISYGMAEAEMGQANNAYVSSLYQMATVEGVSIFVSAGDSGGSFTSNGAVTNTATGGISVSGYASTPYNVAVGGTDFADKYFGSSAQYWSSSNSAIFASALSYIPEIPWNGSCASELLAQSNGYSTAYGITGYCNNGGAVIALAGGGGPSACASGSTAIYGVVGGTCAGYPKPSWQQIVGNPADGVRDIPDVALFASTGTWGHYYVACFSDPSQGGSPCSGASSSWRGYGGTSIVAPIMAGIQALVNEKTGSNWGNPNPVYYNLAATEYGVNGNDACNSDGVSLGASCNFHDITLGDSDVDCTGPNNCFFGLNPGAYGVLSTSNTSYMPAFRATVGWDFATGIGSINAWNLIRNWPAAAPITSVSVSR